MTREEAIICLQGLLDNPLINKGSYLAQALEIAIKALEHPERNVVAVVPCGDTISRQAVIDELNKWDWQELYLPIHFKENIIDVVPSVNPQEPKTGHWILDETDNSITCDKCGCLIWANDISNGEAYYCPNCGCRMVEPQESEDKE